MMSSTNTDQKLHSISRVEQDTGISKDTLRIWERRYDFPTPVRSEKGERLFSDEQILQLLTIRRLMDHGMRAGQVVPLPPRELQKLADQQLGSLVTRAVPLELEEFIDTIRHCDLEGLDELLHRHLALKGLERCVREVITPLMTWIGNLWAADKLEIFEEHLLSRQIYRFLDLVISRTTLANRKHPVILATLPGEQHGLGLTMAEAILLTREIPSINLGTEIPVSQLGTVAKRAEARSIGLSFSAAYPARKIRAMLKDLLEATDPSLEIWAGGSGVQGLKRVDSRIRLIRSLEDL